MADIVWNGKEGILQRQIHGGEKQCLQKEFYQVDKFQEGEGERLPLETEGRTSKWTSLPEIHLGNLPNET